MSWNIYLCWWWNLIDCLIACHTAPVLRYTFGAFSDLFGQNIVYTLLILWICSFTFLVRQCYFITGGVLIVHSSMVINDCWTRYIHIYPNIRWPINLRCPLVIFWLLPEKSICDFVLNYKVSCQHPPHFSDDLGRIFNWNLDNYGACSHTHTEQHSVWSAVSLINKRDCVWW
jgi:hypothetical protein